MARDNRTKAALPVLLTLLVLLTAPGGWAAAAEAFNIRFGQYPDRVRVVIDLRTPTPYRVEPGADGRSVAVLLPGVSWQTPPQRTLSGLEPLVAYRFQPGARPEDNRLVLEADQPIRVISAETFLPDRDHANHRIMVEVAAGTPQAPVPASPQPPSPAQATVPPAADQAAKAAEALERGSLAILGGGPDPDYASAIRWFRKAAYLGSMPAVFDIGELYRTGRGVPQSYAEAAAWFQQASQAGLAPAQFRLGVLYFNGTGVAEDQARGLDLIRRAAAQNDPQARQTLEALGKAEAARKP